MESEKVKEVAETLKKQGLAASMYEAIEKAKRIIGKEEKIEEEKEQKDVERFSQPNHDITKEEVTVNELMKEIGINPEEVKEMEKEKVTPVKEEAEVSEEKQ